MELLWYAPHLNTEKLKVNRFVFGLNGSLREKVRILMPQTLHDAIQKALIAKEELISGGQTRISARPARDRVHRGRRDIRHQRDIHRDIVASRGDPRSLHLDDRRLSSGHLIKDHSTSSSVARSSSSLGLFSRTDQGFRPVASPLLLRVPGLLGRRRGTGRVGSRTTSATVLWRGPERLDQPDPLPWEIWARPIGFM
jgi:hypothetical protein